LCVKHFCCSSDSIDETEESDDEREEYTDEDATDTGDTEDTTDDTGDTTGDTTGLTIPRGETGITRPGEAILCLSFTPRVLFCALLFSDDLSENSLHILLNQTERLT
jgi:hypothetical protein